ADRRSGRCDPGFLELALGRRMPRGGALANGLSGGYSPRSRNPDNQNYAIRIPEHLENSIRGFQVEEPTCFQTLQPGPTRRRQDDERHLRFSVAYWHTFRNPLADPFGVGTAVRPWDDGTNSVKNAQNRARVAFEFMEKLGAPFY